MTVDRILGNSFLISPVLWKLHFLLLRFQIVLKKSNRQINRRSPLHIHTVCSSTNCMALIRKEYVVL